MAYRRGWEHGFRVSVKRLGTQKSETRHMGGFLLMALSRCQLSLPISFLTEAWKAGFD